MFFIVSLFLIIFIEGYVVLSAELLAMRQLLPFVGSGTDTVSIIIAGVLMPLAFGYYAGGHYKASYNRRGELVTIRKKLTNNVVIAAAILLFGLSYIPLTVFFMTFIMNDITHRLILTSLYAILFLVTPIYLLGQTVPLVSNFFSRQRLSKLTGKMLFFSTLGSFLGAVFPTLVLMNFLGVHATVIVNFILLFILVLILDKTTKTGPKDGKFSKNLINMFVIMLVAFILNSKDMLRGMDIVYDNQYNTVAVFTDEEGTKFFSLNNNSSSAIKKDGTMHDYVTFIDENFIAPTQTQETAPKNILIIGAGGFTIGLSDEKNNYTFIDIDPALKDAAETYFLPHKLGDNKKFEPIPARAFLTGTKDLYDLIILDAYLGDMSIPEHLVTKEFFEQVKNKLANDGIMAANFILSPNFRSAFSRNIDTTLRSVFPYISRQIAINFDGWDNNPDKLNNIVYVYWNMAEENEKKTVYTDNRNTMYLDKPYHKVID